ncbi:hypothetical protein D3C77_493430 [compost metagenome]
MKSLLRNKYFWCVFITMVVASFFMYRNINSNALFKYLEQVWNVHLPVASVQTAASYNLDDYYDVIDYSQDEDSYKELQSQNFWSKGHERLPLLFESLKDHILSFYEKDGEEYSKLNQQFKAQPLQLSTSTLYYYKQLRNHSRLMMIADNESKMVHVLRLMY